MDTNSALYKVLVGVDERKSATLMNNQLAEAANQIKDLKVKVKVDTGFAKELQDSITKMQNSIPKNLNVIDRNLLEGHQAEIDELLRKYQHMGGTIEKVLKDTEGDFNGVTLKVQDLQNNIQKINFDKDLNETSSTFFAGFSNNLKELRGGISETEKALVKITKQIASGKAQPGMIEDQQRLTNKLAEDYGKLHLFIQRSTLATEAHKKTLTALVSEEHKASEAAVKNAQALGEQAQNYEKAKAAAAAYKKDLDLLSQVKLGKNVGESEEDIQKRLAAQQEVAKGYSDLVAKMAQYKEAEDRAFNAQQLQKWEKEYASKIKSIQSELSKLETAYVNLDYAETRGQGPAVNKQQNEIERLKKSITESSAAALDLGQKLGVLDDTSDVKSLGVDFEKLEKQMRDSATQVSVLNNKFGEVLATTRSGGSTKPLVEQFLGGSKSEDDLKKLGKAIFGVGAEYVKTTRNNSGFLQMSDKLTYSLRDQDGVWRRYTITLDTANKEIRQTEVALDQTKKQVTGFGSQLTEAAKKIATWGLSTKIVYGTWRAFQDGIQTVKELDNQLTQIAIVQGKGRASAKAYGDTYVDMAVKMAQSVQDVAMLNTELIRQGLSLTEASERADTIMKLSSAGMVSMEQSLQVITTGVNALGVAHEKVADVILKASMLSASDVEGLGEAFSKTASGAKAAGLSIEQTSALLATMKEVTQEGDSQLGTSLKSMLARFNKINEETGELNEDLNQVQTAIESVGVEFLDSGGQIRSFYDIIEDLSVGWDDLDKNTQAYIATQAAGVRQQNRFFALMDNFNKVQAINNDLTHSAGTLQQSYTTYLDSTEAASKRLQATLDKLWMSFIDSDVVIRLTNIATGIVKIIDFMGPLSLAFVALAVKIAVSTTAMKELFLTPVKATPMALSGIEVLKLSFARLGMTISSVKVAAQKFGVALLTALPTMAAFMVAGFAIGKLTEVFMKLADATKAAKQAQIDHYNETIKMIQSQHTQEASIQDLGEEYLSLSRKVKAAGGTYTLTSEELERYYKVQSELKEIIPTLSSYEDERGRTILNGVGSVSSLTESYQELLKVEIERAALDYQDRIIEALEEEGKLLDEIIDKQNKLLGKGSYGSIFEGNEDLRNTGGPTDEELAKQKGVSQEWEALEKQRIEQAMARANAAISALRVEMLREFGSIPTELSILLAQSPIALKIADLPPDRMMEYVRNLKNNLDIALEGANFGEGLSSITDVFEEVERLGEEHVKGIINTEEYQAKLLTLTDSLKMVAESSTEEIKVMVEAALEAIGAMGTGAPQTAEETAERLAKIREDNLESARSAYESASQAALDYHRDLELLNDTETTSIQIQDMILSNYPQWAHMMHDKAALSEAFQNAMIAEDQVRRESYINMLLNTGEFTQQTGGAYQELMAALVGYYQGDISNYAELESVKAQISEKLINELSDEWAKYFKQVGNSIKLNYGAMRNDLQNRVIAGQMTQQEMHGILASAEKNAAAMNTQFSTIIAAFDKFEASIKVPDFSGFAKGLSNVGKAGKAAGAGGKKAADGAKAAGDAAKKAAEDLKAYNEAMKATQQATKEVFDFALEYIEWVEEQKREAMEKTFEDAQTLAEDAFEDAVELIDAEAERLLEMLDIKEKTAKADEEALEYLKRRQELQEGIVDLEYQIAIASFDSSVGGVKRRRELEESLAQEKLNLEQTEEERAKRLQEEAYARERAFIESQAEWERAQAELTKNQKIQNAQDVYDATKAYLDATYTAEKNYLAAKQATQTGMIKNLHGEMIPLVEAFKELAIANGEFWTFFGQQEVADFGEKVQTVLKAVQKLGFEVIQTWKEVTDEIAAAERAAAAAASAASAASSKAPTTVSRPTPAPPAPAATVRPDAPASVIREFQRLLNLVPGSGSAIKVDGSFGGLTTAKADRASAQLRKTAQGKAIANSVDNATIKTLTTSLNQALATAVRAVPVSSTGRTVAAYAEGGKIEHTGPAMVHGSKSKPEYVFNYAQFKDLAKMIAKHELTMPDLKNISTSQPIQINIDRFIEVKGSVDKNTLPELQRMSDNAVAQLTTKLKGWGK